jgi:hypothetical protein
MEVPPLLPVSCGKSIGVLDTSTFLILTLSSDGHAEVLLNPTEYEREAGRALCKKWKVRGCRCCCCCWSWWWWCR